MTPSAQSRHDTPLGGGHGKRHTASLPNAWVRATGSRAAAGFAGARSAALEAVALTQHDAAAVRPAEPIQSSVAAVTTGRLDRGECVEIEIDDGQQGVSSRRTLKRVGQRFEPGGVDGL